VGRAEGDPVPDVVWLTPTGEMMDDDDWDAGFAKSLAMYLNGHGIRESDERGEPVVDDCFFLAFNASDEAIEFALPPEDYAQGWTVVVDTAELGEVEPTTVKPGETLSVAARATVVLCAAQ
jgi:glycogen operon protein